MNKLTNKKAYEIIRDNTNWAFVFPQDVKFKYGWIFHRTRDCLDGEYHKGEDTIDCYATDSLYSYEHTGYQIENWGTSMVCFRGIKSKWAWWEYRSPTFPRLTTFTA